MTAHTNDNALPTAWVDGELRLAGLDNRMIALLRSIEQSGSINQAAKQVGLSYKGAWQIIERANNGSPKALISTATGGSKGGGTSLTEAGRALLALFDDLEQQHRQFLGQLNRNLRANPDTVLLLQRLVVKTSARNQLFGSIVGIYPGEVYAEIIVRLKGGGQIITTVTQASFSSLGLQVGADAVLLVNGTDITLIAGSDTQHCSARNCLSGTVIRILQDEVNAEVIMLLPGGETLAALVTLYSAQSLALAHGMPVTMLFKSNAPVLGVMPPH